MPHLTINIAAEDRLGIAALRRILSDKIENIQIAQILPSLKHFGNSPIRARVENFRKASEFGQYFIVLTDLDNGHCPLKLLQDWKVLPLPERLLFRVAVREIESWLLGDRQNIAKLLGIKLGLVPPYPEQLDDPKAVLLELAKKGNKRIQKELLPEKGTLGKIGPGYNDTLCTFVESDWNYENAAINSPSLSRFLNRIDQLDFQ